MPRMRLRDLFAKKPAGSDRGKCREDKPLKQLPFDPDGLMERALDSDEPDLEGFA